MAGSGKPVRWEDGGQPAPRITLSDGKVAEGVALVDDTGAQITDFGGGGSNPNTGTLSNVADTASSTTILAANSSRKGASVANDSSAALYLKMGSTASTTSYTVRLVQHAYWECPFGYTGIITGIWATDPGDGAARVTEYTTV